MHIQSFCIVVVKKWLCDECANVMQLMASRQFLCILIVQFIISLNLVVGNVQIKVALSSVLLMFCYW
jgi:hypothetical protein